jgi:hypothetical protein
MNEWNSSAGVYGDSLLSKNINIINRQLQKIWDACTDAGLQLKTHVCVV